MTGSEPVDVGSIPAGGTFLTKSSDFGEKVFRWYEDNSTVRAGIEQCEITLVQRAFLEILSCKRVAFPPEALCSILLL